ncbi:MAG: HU family DNA-binding protein [Acidobacteria bacterium]|nr:HU family DNA-binding protein [Acidobacteriota bacterium]
MTKKELADAVYNVHGGLSRKEAADVIDAVLGKVKDSLFDGEKVQITKFGVFEIQKKLERRGVNPLTGEIIDIPAHRAIVFRPSSHLKSAMNHEQQ